MKKNKKMEEFMRNKVNKNDKIYIRDLVVFANHGVMKEEQVLGQKFLVSCVLHTDLSRAGDTDNLKYSVNYASVCEFITKWMKENTYQLLEACASHLCNEILMEFRSIDRVEIELKKPWAPIGLPLDTVSVSMERAWHIAYIALGSNIGDSRALFCEAIDKIESRKDCDIIKISDYITTKPYGPVKQDDFLNGAIMIRTILSPIKLLDLLNNIEAEAGRERVVHWGPRTLDLDILLYDDLMMSTDDLTIPHIDMHNRDFVLKPLAQIAPYELHPVYKKTIIELLEDLNI